MQRKSVLQPAIRASCSWHVLAHKSFHLVPKPFLISRINYNPSVIWTFPKNSTCPLGKLRTKLTSHRLPDMTFYAGCNLNRPHCIMGCQLGKPVCTLYQYVVPSLCNHLCCSQKATMQRKGILFCHILRQILSKEHLNAAITVGLLKNRAYM